MADRTLDLAIATAFVGGRWRFDISARMKTQDEVEKVIRALETFRPLLLENPVEYICIAETEY